MPLRSWKPRQDRSGAALREALFGNAAEAQQRATAALELAKSRDVQFGAALALALAGDSVRAQALVNDLASSSPKIRSCSSITCQPFRLSS